MHGAIRGVSKAVQGQQIKHCTKADADVEPGWRWQLNGSKSLTLGEAMHDFVTGPILFSLKSSRKMAPDTKLTWPLFPYSRGGSLYHSASCRIPFLRNRDYVIAWQPVLRGSKFFDVLICVSSFCNHVGPAKALTVLPGRDV